MVGECAASCALEQDEGVLRDVLNELEKERIRRAELENQIIEMNKGDENNDQSHHEADESTTPQDINDIDFKHRLNSLLAEYNSKVNGLTQSQHFSTNLSPLLVELFNELFDSAIGINKHSQNAGGYDSLQEKKKYESIREKHVKEAVLQVMSYYEKHSSKRLSLKENTEETLSPILNITVTDFTASLKRMERDTAEQRDTENTLVDQNNNNEVHLKLLSLRTENNGLLDIIDALTSDNNAISLASKNTENSLPIHTVMCLEVMPWDSLQYASVFEEVHEWQIYDDHKQTWISKQKAFPPCLANLPTRDHENISDQLSETDSYQFSPLKRKNRLQRAVQSFSLNNCFLTDATCRSILDLRHGYPLPTRGEWEWVGGWIFKDDPELNDDDGWTYAERPEDHISESNLRCYNSEKPPTYLVPTRCFRRRTSRRQRVLISYPGISQRTKQMLSMHAQNTKLMHGISKLNDKVLFLQDQVSEKESEIDYASMESRSQLSSAECEIDEREKKIRDMEQDSNGKTNKLFTKTVNSSTVKLLRGKTFRGKTVSSLLADVTKMKLNKEKSVTSESSSSVKAGGFFESLINSKEYYENIVNNATSTTTSNTSKLTGTNTENSESGATSTATSTATSKTSKLTETHTENSEEDTLAANSDSIEAGSLELDEYDTINDTNTNWLMESVRNNVETISKSAKLIHSSSE